MFLYKIAFAVLALTAVIKQFGLIEHTAFRITNFFSYFTIESNIFGAAMLIISAIFLLRGMQSTTLNYFRGAATLYMVVTGIVYTLLLRGADVQTGSSWINSVLHYIFPCVMLFDWFWNKARPVSLTKALWWLAFPLVYLVYSLIRGHFVHWYPYPFLNAEKHGYLGVALTSVAITVAGVVLALLIARYSQLSTRAPKKTATARR